MNSVVGKADIIVATAPRAIHKDNNVLPLIHIGLPRSLESYTDLIPLESPHSPRNSVTFNLPGICYKAWSPRYNRNMLLRRIVLPADACDPVLSAEQMRTAKQLSEMDHAAVVGLRDVFFTDAFNDLCKCVCVRVNGWHMQRCAPSLAHRTPGRPSGVHP